MALVVAGGTAWIVSLGWRAVQRPVATGQEALVGGYGEAVSDLALDGLVRLRGELWLAEAPQPVSKGQRVQVVEVTGARLMVRPWR